MPTKDPTREWQPIPEWEHYEVSSLGEVRRITPFWPNRPIGILKPISSGRTGYLYANLTKGPKRSRMLIHRLVLLAFCGLPPTPKHETRHLNGNRKDNRLDNLAWGTRMENSADRTRHGNTPRGETHRRSKLSSSQVLEIREYGGSATRKEIAARYGVSRSIVNGIINRKIWKHI